MKIFGIIGFPLEHSFSPTYFKRKFQSENLSGYDYRLFTMKDVKQIRALCCSMPELSGLNVTIPHKINIIEFLDEIDEQAANIGAVNTLKITHLSDRVHIKGYNTDCDGFNEVLKTYDLSRHKKALVLGTGGAALAVAFALRKHNITTTFVSRKAQQKDILNYSSLSSEVMTSHTIIINATPLGMFPNINDCVNIPFNLTGRNHLFIDLIYNPETTKFLKNAQKQNALTCNGIGMLHAQAEKSWQIWNENQ
ncbi:MAG: shikimate dehydrogenase [Bacteroidales bacterium]|nr:shikimate dehydrogenase [Bacteroidales bacterium]